MRTKRPGAEDQGVNGSQCQETTIACTTCLPAGGHCYLAYGGAGPPLALRPTVTYSPVRQLDTIVCVHGLNRASNALQMHAESTDCQHKRAA